MIPSIRRLFEELERRKQAMLSDVLMWSAEQIRFRPDPASWSSLDVFDHLLKVEEELLKAVQHQLPEGNPMTFRDRVGGLFINSVMQSPMRVKVPASASIVLPDSKVDLGKVIERWDEARLELADLLQSLQPEQFRRGLFRHPVSGWMTMSMALSFLSAHLRHHGYQLKRLKSATRFL